MYALFSEVEKCRGIFYLSVGGPMAKSRDFVASLFAWMVIWSVRCWLYGRPWYWDKMFLMCPFMSASHNENENFQLYNKEKGPKPL